MATQIELGYDKMSKYCLRTDKNNKTALRGLSSQAAFMYILSLVREEIPDVRVGFNRGLAKELDSESS